MEFGAPGFAGSWREIRQVGFYIKIERPGNEELASYGVQEKAVAKPKRPVWWQ